jgi:hypothetical protein
MVLLPNETKLFFDNFFGILSYLNDKYNLVEDFGHPQNPSNVGIKDIQLLKDKLWNDVGIIDEYIDSIWDMPKENIEILKGWKKKISGRYVIVRHLKKYSVFLNEKNNSLYSVLGITNSIDDMIYGRTLPVLVEAVLLPFRNQIIHDSVLQMYNISFGSNFRRDLNERYMKIKKEKGIITTIH